MTQPRPNTSPPDGYSVPPSAYAQPGHPPPAAPGGAPLADFGTRLAAYLLDRVIIGVAVLIPTLVVTVLLVLRFVDVAGHTPSDRPPDLRPLVGLWLATFATLLVLSTIVQYLYLVTYQSRTGQTIGKRAMRLRVVSAVDGGPMTVPAARKRFLVEVGGSLLGPLAYLDGLWQLWDQPHRQCLHDKWAQTVVVKVAP